QRVPLRRARRRRCAAVDRLSGDVRLRRAACGDRVDVVAPWCRLTVLAAPGRLQADSHDSGFGRSLLAGDTMAAILGLSYQSFAGGSAPVNLTGVAPTISPTCARSLT